MSYNITSYKQYFCTDANSNNNSNKLQTLTQEQLEQLTGINQSNNNSVRNNNNNNRQQGIVEVDLVFKLKIKVF